MYLVVAASANETTKPIMTIAMRDAAQILLNITAPFSYGSTRGELGAKDQNEPCLFDERRSTRPG